MSDYGITKDEFLVMAQNALDTMGRLFLNDRVSLNVENRIKIYEQSYR